MKRIWVLITLFLLWEPQICMALNPKEIDLILSGSGTRYPVYVGAVRALLENGYQIKRVAGVSGGGIVACALSYGIINLKDSPEKILKQITYKAEKENIFIKRWKRRYNLIRYLGFSTGENFESFLDKTFEGKMMSSLKIPIRIYATDIWNQKVVTFSNADPLKISRVLRMTTSLPIVFAPVQYQNGLIVDGGIGLTFPFNTFKDHLRPVIGIQLKTPEIFQKKNESPSDLSLFQYIKLILLTFFSTLEHEHTLLIPPPGVKIIVLDTRNVSLIDPEITENEIMNLYQIGYEEMQLRMQEIKMFLKKYYSNRNEQWVRTRN